MLSFVGVSIVCGAAALVLIAAFILVFLFATSKTSKTSNTSKTQHQTQLTVPKTESDPASNPESDLAAAPTASEHNQVVEIDEKAALDLLSVHSSTKPSIVMVFKNQCKGCAIAKPEFAAAAKMQTKARFYAIDGERAPTLRAAHNIRWYPSFIGVSSKGVVPFPPNNARTAAKFVEFAESLTTSASESSASESSAFNTVKVEVQDQNHNKNNTSETWSQKQWNSFVRALGIKP